MPTHHLQKLTSKRIAFRHSWLRVAVIPGQVLLTPVSVQDARACVYAAKTDDVTSLMLMF